MYADTNPKSKKQLREQVEQGRAVYLFSPGPFPAPLNGWTTCEGPHYPMPHKWYAQVRVENGRIVEVKK
jgi:hypothetical protein